MNNVIFILAGLYLAACAYLVHEPLALGVLLLIGMICAGIITWFEK